MFLKIYSLFTFLWDLDVLIRTEQKHEAFVNDRSFFQHLGNEYFKRGDFTEAIKHYSEAIGLDPENYVFYSNRSVRFRIVTAAYSRIELVIYQETSSRIGILNPLLNYSFEFLQVYVFCSDFGLGKIQSRR